MYKYIDNGRMLIESIDNDSEDALLLQINIKQTIR